MAQSTMAAERKSKVHGSFRQVDVPRPNIYISGSAAAGGSALPRRKYRFSSEVGSCHFYLILQCGLLYTEEEVTNCQGKYHCHNCTRPIPRRIYFYPEEFDPRTNEPICNPIPHCRTACVYRTVQDLTNNGDLLTNFFLMFGHDVIIAPERFLLSIPGGLSLDEYHKVIDDKLIIQREEPHIRSCHAAIFISCTLFKNHQLVPDTVAFIDEMQVERKNAMGPSRIRDNSDLKVMEMPPKRLQTTKLSDMFTVEPSSFQRGTALTNNPHMSPASDPLPVRAMDES